ncbi:MAG: hypothetical protein ACXWQE_14910, partial [Bdellovibrionales bacterium]
IRDTKNPIYMDTHYTASAKTSGDLVPVFRDIRLRDVRVLENFIQDARALGVEFTTIHAHVVAEQQFHADDPELHATLIADYYRRANFALELIDILQVKENINPIENGEYTYWSHLDAENLGGVAAYLLDAARGKVRAIADDFKLAYIGFRGSDKYDEPGLFGFEIRYFPPPVRKTKRAAELAALYADGIQKGLVTRNYGVSPEQMSAWIQANQKPKQKLPNLIASTWYDRSERDLIKNLPAESRALVNVGAIEDAVAASGDQAKILFHRWDLDPLAQGNAAWQALILAQQKIAIDRVLKNPRVTAKAVREFLMDSQIAQRFVESIGAKLP